MFIDPSVCLTVKRMPAYIIRCTFELFTIELRMHGVSAFRNGRKKKSVCIALNASVVQVAFMHHLPGSGIVECMCNGIE